MTDWSPPGRRKKDNQDDLGGTKWMRQWEKEEGEWENSRDGN